MQTRKNCEWTTEAEAGRLQSGRERERRSRVKKSGVNLRLKRNQRLSGLISLEPQPETKTAAETGKGIQKFHIKHNQEMMRN